VDVFLKHGVYTVFVIPHLVQAAPIH